MATKKTPTKAAPAAKATTKTASKKAKPAAEASASRHPAGRLKALHGTKAQLVSKIAGPLTSTSDDAESVKGRLARASNKQLLHLASVVETVEKRFGGRAKLIGAIGDAAKKSKDKDYLAMLGTLSLPRLLDLATAGQRRAKNA